MIKEGLLGDDASSERNIIGKGGLSLGQKEENRVGLYRVWVTELYHPTQRSSAGTD